MKYHLTIILLLLLDACNGQDADPFIAKRIQQNAEITLNGPIAKVFTLFGIMREKEWDPDWHPTPVFPPSGDIAEGAVYHTPGHVPGEPPLTWVVALYDKVLYRLTYLVSAPDRIVEINIQCKTIGDNNTSAIVTYMLTGLTTEGNEMIGHHLAAIFSHNLHGWQTSINERLKHMH